jgi:hypothetical protein
VQQLQILRDADFRLGSWALALVELPFLNGRAAEASVGRHATTRSAANERLATYAFQLYLSETSGS